MCFKPMMSQSEIDRAIAYGSLAFFAAVAAWLCGLVVSTFMLVGLGAMSGSFDHWRTDRGLWMLSALFLFIFGGFYAVFTYHQFADWVAGRAVRRGLIAIDYFIATSVLAYAARFLWAVTYWNRQASSDA